MEFVNSVPAAWTVYGIWITYGRITGVLTTALTAGGTGAVTYLLTGSTSSSGGN